ncbi:MAG: hypothetical protein ACLFNI_11690 [Natronomonas sp.]
MALDTLTITMGKLGSGEWELELQDGETLEVFLDDVEVSEIRGFFARGHHVERELLVELTTGTQPGGPIRLRQRKLVDEKWEEVGELADARKLDRAGT